jgi:ABC-type dipeptide/oligopeptide/nickel transport system ATPase component
VNCRKRSHVADFLRKKHPCNQALQKSIPALHEKGEALHTIPDSPPDLSKPNFRLSIRATLRICTGKMCNIDDRPEGNCERPFFGLLTN